MEKICNAHDWYWFVKDQNAIFSAAAGNYIAASDVNYKEFCKHCEPTKIGTHAELLGVLRQLALMEAKEVQENLILDQVAALGTKAPQAVKLFEKAKTMIVKSA